MQKEFSEKWNDPHIKSLIYEAHFRDCVEGIIAVDSSSTIFMANSIASEMFEYEEGALVGKSISILLPNRFTESHHQKFKNYQKNPHSRPIGQGKDLWGKKKNGVEFPVEISLSHVELKGEGITIAIISDISERKKMEQELEQMLKILNESLNEIYLFDSTTFEFVQINKRAIRNLGYTFDELKVMKPWDLKPAYTETSFKQKVLPIINGESTSIHFETVHQRVDGSQYPVSVHLELAAFQAKEVFVAIILDTTHLKESQSALKNSQQRLKAIIDNAVDGIISINERGIIESMNPSSLGLFGYDETELIGKNINVLMPEPDHSNHDQYIRNYLTTSVKKIIGIGRDVMGKRKDGSLFPFRLSISENKIGDQRLFTGIVHDLTEQKYAEEQLKEHSEQLEQRVKSRTEALGMAIRDLERQIIEREKIEKELIASKEETQKALQKEIQLNELKSRFVSMASHEFRTPLATILSSISLIDRYHDPENKEKRIKHINRIKSNVGNLTNILNDFLSLSKLEEGKIGNKPSEFDLFKVLLEVIEEMTSQAKDGQVIQFESEGEPNVEMDEHLLKNIIMNLISNAIKYSPMNSSIGVKVKNIDGKAFISVSDQGMGIPMEEQKHLFQRFFRANNATNIQGTGLGLSIVQKYIELMQGSIEFESKEGEGTIFSLILPNNYSTT